MTVAVQGKPARTALLLSALLVACVVSVAIAIAVGSEWIPLRDVATVMIGGDASDPGWDFIVREVRLPRAVTAVLAGAALSVAGLQMQTLFRNALADPYVLGANSGASFGVAVVVLTSGASWAGFTSGLAGGSRTATVLAAALGAAVVLGVVLIMAHWVRNAVVLLLVGVMVGAVTASLVSVLIVYASTPESVQQFLKWGMGSFSNTVWSDMTVFVPLVAGAALLCFATARSLNALLLGENYARSMGVDLRWARTMTLASSALMTGVVTAYCGPIGFLGLVVPHLTRGLFRSSNHRTLIPGCVTVGALLALWCSILSELPGSGHTLPLNAVTAIIGAPIVITVLVRGRVGGTV